LSPVVPLFRADGGVQPISDLTLTMGPNNGDVQLTAATDEGLFIARYHDSGFVLPDAGPVSAALAWDPIPMKGLPNLQCPAAPDAGPSWWPIRIDTSHPGTLSVA